MSLVPDTFSDDESVTAPLLPPTAATATGAPAERTPLPFKQMLVLCIINICEPIQLTILFPFIYFMVKDFGVAKNDSEIGWYVGLITSLFSFAQVLSSLPIGWLSDKIGRRPVLLLGLAGNMFSSILFGLSTNLPAAIVSRFLLGLVNGNIGVAKSMTGEITDKSNRPAAFALFGVCFSLGGIVGPMIGGTLSNPVTQLPWLFGSSKLFREFPYLLPCLVSSFVSLTGLVVGWFHLEETLRRESEEVIVASASLLDQDAYQNTQSSVNPLPHPAIRKDRFPAKAYPAVLGLGLLAMTGIISEEFYPLLCTLPVDQLQNGFGFKSFEIGLSLSIRGCFTFLTQIFVFPFIQKTYGSLRSVRLALSVFLTSVTCLPFLTYIIPTFGEPTFWVFLVANLAFLTAGQMSTFTSMFLVVNESAETQSQLGRVNGMAQMAACVARTVGPLIGGFVWTRVFAMGVWWGKHVAYAVVVVVGGLLYLETFWIQKALGETAFDF
ncbi:hypothetical protein CcCBS67573_g03458 [Chytriomyces confervae]|uniref:Major facilitator superfamily (MFS) profile domain-containing protein n=1 Tax=Chytriomyces confervae TaxID=246404 RepID=A0A507FJK1_9FUNG|nr:hypothetical protein CcCBS67573_g03458 [Chytriomyces confervae]